MNQLPLFSLLAPWPSDQQKQFIESLKRRSFQDGAIIFERGESSSDVYFIISGSIKSLNYSKNGSISYFRMRYAGNCFGYYSAISELPRTATYLAVGQTELAIMSGAEFFSLVLEHKNVCRNFLKLLVELFRLETERLTNMTTLPTHQRVAAELLAQYTNQGGPNIVLPDRDEFASYLGMTRETLSRILNYLVKKKFIKVSKNQIVILDPDTLGDFTET
jgi:CRP/FNR family transcriptional regulator, cyclic AMP receptor protein